MQQGDEPNENLGYDVHLEVPVFVWKCLLFSVDTHNSEYDQALTCFYDNCRHYCFSIIIIDKR